MEYNKIVAVTGLPGLYELLSSKADGAIVRSLDDKTTRFVSNRLHNFSHLETIEVYTTRDNVNLVDVFNAMQKSAQSLPSEKDASAIKKYFTEVFPDMDFERVYDSDRKKMIKWYTVLNTNNVEFKLTEMPEQEDAPEAGSGSASVEAGSVAEPVTEKKKATTKKKAAEKSAATEIATEEAADAPKKRAPRKKKTEE